MVFNSLTFAVFLAVVIGLNRLPVPWRGRKAILLLASYAFYAAWNPPFVVLLWLSTVVDWFVAKAIARSTQTVRRRVLLFVSLTTNLGLLAFFKYGGFLLDTFVRAAAMVGVDYQPPAFDIVLPVGISFYTFQTLSYTIDVYRGSIRPWPSFLDFALFVTFFPQLVAGPIMRASAFLPQCVEERNATRTQFGWGAVMLVIGLFEKVVMADAILAPVADKVFTAAARAGFVDTWVGVLAFSGQIFFDFAGYSTCAIGVALMLGFIVQDNFRFPYASIGFLEFWQRWNISLSTWLRDYLYVPLGGVRGGSLRAICNLMVTMLLGGLWHGASWRFVVWGGLHGLYLVVERWLRTLWSRPASWLQTTAGGFAMALLTHFFLCFTWPFFRADGFASATAMIRAMFGISAGNIALGHWPTIAVAVITVGLLVSHWRLRDSSLEEWWNNVNSPVRVVLVAGMLLAIALTNGDNRAFIYFQF